MRKGARKFSEIKPEILNQLNVGNIESANLVECLAVDFNKLAKTNNIKAQPYFEKSIIKKMKYFATHIDDWQKFKKHTSDTIRGCCAFNICQQKNLKFSEKLKYIIEFAQDEHFAVREWSWLALRDDIISNLDEALAELTILAKNNSSYIRRFSSEASRPRGVWCRHIKKLKDQPQLAINIITKLNNDDSKYVRDSVGNWLNDASKDNPKWTMKVCQKWQEDLNLGFNKAYIIKRSLRTLKQKKAL